MIPDPWCERDAMVQTVDRAAEISVGTDVLAGAVVIKAIPELLNDS